MLKYVAGTLAFLAAVLVCGPVPGFLSGYLDLSEQASRDLAMRCVHLSLMVAAFFGFVPSLQYALGGKANRQMIDLCMGTLIGVLAVFAHQLLDSGPLAIGVAVMVVAGLVVFFVFSAVVAIHEAQKAKPSPERLSCGQERPGYCANHEEPGQLVNFKT